MSLIYLFPPNRSRSPNVGRGGFMNLVQEYFVPAPNQVFHRSINKEIHPSPAPINQSINP